MTTGAANEIDLARRLLSGEPEAFDRFVEIYRPKIFQYAYLMCGHREDAEEVTQEALLTVFEKLAQLREPERLRPWVFRIARNACFMKRRKSVFAPVQELSLDELTPGHHKEGEHRKIEIADWSLLPEEVAINSEMMQILHRKIEQLPEIYRAVIVLRDIEELSTQEAAEVLDISADTVKTRLHRARLAVRRQLDEHLRSSGGVQ